MPKDFKRGVLSRSSQMIKMAAQIAGHEARHRVGAGLKQSAEGLGAARLGTTLAQAEALADGLSQLKGAAMKAGQLLSIDAGDLLPPEAARVLGRLQADAAPVPFETMATVLCDALGPDWSKTLRGLDCQPAASASIGQVHRAVFDGEPVAVKIQYPGIAQSIDADLDMLRKLSGSLLTLSGRRMELDELFKEMKDVLHQEADYSAELAHTQRFAAHLEGHPTFVVPTAHDSVSSARVLVSSWEDGLPLGAWIESGPSEQECLWFARAVLDLYCLEFFSWGLVQTDPNPGNFLVRPQTRQIVLLDFGATLAYEEEFRTRYVQLLKVLGEGEAQQVINIGLEQGMIDARESPEVKQLFAELLISAVEPFAPRNQPFNFADPEYATRARDVGQAFTRGLRYSPPPRELVFLHRKLGGLFNILKRMGVQMDLKPYWQTMVGTYIRSAA